jgi:hypothetical protein
LGKLHFEKNVFVSESVDLRAEPFEKLGSFLFAQNLAIKFEDLVLESGDFEGFFCEKVFELVQLFLENSFQVQKRLIFSLFIAGMLLTDPRLIELFSQRHPHIVHLCL